MSKPNEKRLGRPPNPNTPRHTLGSVRVTDEQLASYTNAGELKGKSRADWVRDTLDKAAARALK